MTTGSLVEEVKDDENFILIEIVVEHIKSLLQTPCHEGRNPLADAF